VIEAGAQHLTAITIETHCRNALTVSRRKAASALTRCYLPDLDDVILTLNDTHIEITEK